MAVQMPKPPTRSTRAASRLASALAALLCLTALLGLVVQFEAQLGRMPDPLAALWALLRFFTILANLLVVVVFGWAAFAKTPPILLNGVILSMMLVGIVYVLLLSDTPLATSGDRIANALLHYATPLLALIYWLARAPHGDLGWRAPLGWAAFPVAYVLYALARGTADGRYPYPFLDAAKLGGAQVLVNCILLGGGFMLAGYGLVALDKARDARRSR
jgi:hypothetical protein